MGQLDRLRTELPESAEPIVPKRWGELNTVTIAFGHGLSVAPLQAVMAVGALMNGGMLIPPTFLKRTEEEATQARRARDQAGDQRDDALPDAPQRREGLGQEGRRRRATMSAARPARPRRSSTAAIPRPSCSPPSRRCCPADKPRYLFCIMLDEPQGAARDARLRDLGLERRADGGQGHRAHRAAARRSSRASTCRRRTS